MFVGFTIIFYGFKRKLGFNETYELLWFKINKSWFSVCVLDDVYWVGQYSSPAGNWIWGWRDVMRATEGSCWEVKGSFRGNPECCVYKRGNKAREGSYTNRWPPLEDALYNANTWKLKMLPCSNYYLGPPCAPYLHNIRVCTGSRALRFADEVRLRVCAAETLVPLPQAAVAGTRGLWCGKTHTVTLFTRKVSGCGGRENDKLASSPSSTAAVLKTSCIVQTCGRRKGFVAQLTQCKYILSHISFIILTSSRTSLSKTG